MSDRYQLVEAELDALYLVSQVLNSTLDLRHKLGEVLGILHKRSNMLSGMVALRGIETNSLSVCEVYGEDIDKTTR